MRNALSDLLLSVFSQAFESDNIRRLLFLASFFLGIPILRQKETCKTPVHANATSIRKKKNKTEQTFHWSTDEHDDELRELTAHGPSFLILVPVLVFLRGALKERRNRVSMPVLPLNSTLSVTPGITKSVNPTLSAFRQRQLR